IVPGAPRRGHVHEPSLDVDVRDLSFDEAGPPERGPDRLRAMPQLQPARAGLEEERGEDEGVVATDQGDIDPAPRAAEALEMAGHGDAAESASEHHDPRRRGTVSHVGAPP